MKTRLPRAVSITVNIDIDGNMKTWLPRAVSITVNIDSDGNMNQGYIELCQ